MFGPASSQGKAERKRLAVCVLFAILVHIGALVALQRLSMPWVVREHRPVELTLVALSSRAPGAARGDLSPVAAGAPDEVQPEQPARPGRPASIARARKAARPVADEAVHSPETEDVGLDTTRPVGIAALAGISGLHIADLAHGTTGGGATAAGQEGPPGEHSGTGAGAGAPGLGGGGGAADYDAAMTAPRLVSGPEIQYTPAALEREVEGLVLVRCVVTVEGAVRSCQVVKGLPFMEEAVVTALEQRRYAPATLGGRAVNVRYTFKVRLELPVPR